MIIDKLISSKKNIIKPKEININEPWKSSDIEILRFKQKPSRYEVSIGNAI